MVAWMPFSNAVTGIMFPDVVLRKSDGGMKEYEKNYIAGCAGYAVCVVSMFQNVRG